MAQKEEYSYTMLAKLLIVFLIVHLLAVITLILMFSSEHEVASSSVLPVSSVWCSGDTFSTRRCYFKNLCYSHDHSDFVFVNGEGSVRRGLPTDRNEPLADLSGGVVNHGNSDYHFSFIDIPQEAVGKKNLTSTILPDKVVIFKRFKPDNLMHVFHDDLIPLYFTLNELDHFGAKDYRVFFVDDHEAGRYWELYRMFRSKNFLNAYHPLLRSTVKAEGLLDSDANLICFSTVVVGGAYNTRWYQYGFNQFQGSVPTTLTGSDIREFAESVRKALEIPKYNIDKPTFSARTRQKNPYAVVLSRKSNRRIINVLDVATTISRDFKLRVITVDLETHSLPQIVYLLENATMLVSMHGAELILSMFLPEYSVVIELFPYGIPPENYTPYKTLTKIKGINLIYRSWGNKDPLKTVTHPKYAPEYGGISLYLPETQKLINESIPVKPHFCCKNREFLYRIYQDTEVDVVSFGEIVESALEERNKTLLTVKPREGGDIFSPGMVTNITCEYRTEREVFHVDWDPPWNLRYIRAKNVTYVIRVQEKGATSYQPFESVETHFEVSVKDLEDVYVWISCQANGVSGVINKRPGNCSKNLFAGSY